MGLLVVDSYCLIISFFQDPGEEVEFYRNSTMPVPLMLINRTLW